MQNILSTARHFYTYTLTPGLAVKVDGCEHSKCQSSTGNFESKDILSSQAAGETITTTTITFLSAPPLPPFILLLFHCANKLQYVVFEHPNRELPISPRGH